MISSTSNVYLPRTLNNPLLCHFSELLLDMEDYVSLPSPLVRFEQQNGSLKSIKILRFSTTSTLQNNANSFASSPSRSYTPLSTCSPALHETPTSCEIHRCFCPPPQIIWRECASLNPPLLDHQRLCRTAQPLP